MGGVRLDAAGDQKAGKKVNGNGTDLTKTVATLFLGMALGGGVASIVANINMTAVAQRQAAHEREPGHREMVVSQQSQDAQYTAILRAIEDLDEKLDEHIVTAREIR